MVGNFPSGECKMMLGYPQYDRGRSDDFDRASIMSTLTSVPSAEVWRYERLNSYANPVLFWLEAGEAELFVHGVRAEAKGPSALYLPREHVVSFKFKGEWSGTMLQLPITRRFDLSENAFLVHLGSSEGGDGGPVDRSISEYEDILRAISVELDRDAPSRDQAIEHYLGLATIWFERQARIQPNALLRSDAASRLVNRFMTAVEADFRSANSVSDYARAFDVSPTHLTRVCKKTSGTTPSDLLIERKMAEARRLLADTPMRVMNISNELGFTSAPYFTRAFQSRVGMAPGEFRKLHRSIDS